MRAAKITITIDEELLNRLDRLDRLVGEKRFSDRSQAVQEAVREKIERLERNRLAHECAKLDPRSEQQLAEEGFSEDAEQWPAY